MSRPRNGTLNNAAAPFEVWRRERPTTTATAEEARRAPYAYLATYDTAPTWAEIQAAHGAGDYELRDSAGGVDRRTVGPARAAVALATVGGGDRHLRDELERVRAELAEARAVDPMDWLEQSRQHWMRLDAIWGHTRPAQNPAPAAPTLLEQLSTLLDKAPAIVNGARALGLVGGPAANPGPDPWAAVATAATAAGLTPADLLSWVDDYRAEQSSSASSQPL